MNNHEKTSYGTKAKLLLNHVKTFEFLLMVHMLNNILDQFNRLDECLHELDIDSVVSKDLINVSINNLQSLRKDSSFNDLFNRCLILAKDYGIKTVFYNLISE